MIVEKMWRDHVEVLRAAAIIKKEWRAGLFSRFPASVPVFGIVTGSNWSSAGNGDDT
jgi:hypothetical protein